MAFWGLLGFFDGYRFFARVSVARSLGSSSKALHAVSEFPKYHFHGLLLVKQVTEAIPDSRDGN